MLQRVRNCRRYYYYYYLAFVNISVQVIRRIHGAIVAATIAERIAPTGCGDDRGDDRPVYTLGLPR